MVKCEYWDKGSLFFESSVPVHGDYQETDNGQKKKAATRRVAAFQNRTRINPSICSALACMALLEEHQCIQPALSLASLI